jgi:hypothetical protein
MPSIYKKQEEAGLTPGMEGTTTLYEPAKVTWGSNNYFGDARNWTSTPSNPNGRSITFYTPNKDMFVEPLEGWDRFYNQALSGDIQEEYFNPAYTGMWGKDTTNFDRILGLDPFKKDWNLQNPYFKEIDNKPFLLEALTNPGMLLMAGGLGAVLGGPALAAAGAAGGTGGGAMGLASLPAAGTWAQTALPALGASAGQWTLPAALTSAVTPLAGATQGLAQTIQEMLSNLGVGSDAGFNTPLTTQSSSFVTEGANMFEDLFPAFQEGVTSSAPWNELGMIENMTNTIGAGGSPFAGADFMNPEWITALSGGMDAASPGILSQIFDFMKSPAGQLTKSGLNLAGKFGSAAMSNNAAKRMQDQLVSQMDKYQQAADPFGAQRPYYQDELKKAYMDPTAIYGSDEYQSLKKIFEEGIRRRDAAQGRRNSNEFPRAIELQDHFMKYLGDYRKGLNAPAGVDINPNGLFGSMLNNFQQGQQGRLSALGSIPNAIGSIFDPYQNQKEQLSTRLASILEKFMNQ